MNKKRLQEPIPDEKHETIRKDIIHELKNRELSARDISMILFVPEREVYDHLEHIHKSLSRHSLTLVTKPSECSHCGFVFKKRERMNKPGKCPLCKGEKILPPAFSIIERGNT